jgi:hypothetical protein
MKMGVDKIGSETYPVVGFYITNVERSGFTTRELDVLDRSCRTNR